jgi:hypothetical protein
VNKNDEKEEAGYTGLFFVEHRKTNVMDRKPVTFDLLLNQVPYAIKAAPYPFNNETRFEVTYNDSPAYVFAWDEEAEQFMAIGDEASTIPDEVEEAVAVKLLQIVTDGKGDLIQE